MKKLIISLLLAGGLLGTAAAAEPEARITAVKVLKTNLVVEVEASGSLVKVMLESSTRVGRQSWEPRAAKHLEPAEGTRQFTFTVPITPAMEILRVRAESDALLPASFYAGTNEFASWGSTPGEGATGGMVEFDGTGAPTAGGDEGRRSVVESDIYKLKGDTLYFFNQYRGLQVIDVSDPDAPAITGTYDLTAAGEQMYLMGENQVVLLARDDCSWYGSSSGSKVVLLEVIDGSPQLVKELPVPGYTVESRLVGTSLYVVANSYNQRMVAGQENWTWGTLIASFDLSDFETAAEKSTEWVEGYGNTIYATDEFLFVAHNAYDNGGYVSKIHINDISAPDGEIIPRSVLTVNGRVQDKFKMNQNGDVFSVVTMDFTASRPTVVRTFSLENPESPKALGSLTIIENEQLHATRFHGNTLYAVTFFIIDPLWVIDLTDPAAPKKTGELEIPGWSTYLQPIGDKLLAIGVDQENGEQRIAVQLFDVSDPTDPTLASKVLIGDGWSGSEANWDEKAFGVLPEENLVMVPFHSYGENGNTRGVQLIDLLPDSLVKRGVIEQNVAARRATVHKDRILALSMRELLTVDATDRDNPTVTTRTELSWAAERLHLAGEHLIELDASLPPVVRIVSAEDPEQLLTTVALPDLPYLGSGIANGKLYVLQGRPRQVVWPSIYDPQNWRPLETNEGTLVCSEFSLDSLPELPRTDRAEKTTDLEFYNSNLKPLEVKDDLIVWAGSVQPIYGWGWGWGWDIRGPVVAFGAPMIDSAAGASLTVAPGWYGGGSGTFIPVKTGSKLEFGTEVKITAEENAWFNHGDSFTANGLVYSSHLASGYDAAFDPPPYTYEKYDGTRYVTATNDPPPGAWVQRHYLDVIDFNDPDEPLVRKPVNIPGSLIGIDGGGELLYTKGQDSTSYPFTATEFLAASAYDGVAAALIDSIELPNGWPRPVLEHKGFVYAGVPPLESNDQKASIQVWALDSAGEFNLVNNVGLRAPAQQLEAFGDLLVVQADQILLFDASTPTELRQTGSGATAKCYGVTLEKGDGELGRGVWLPMGWYGVVKIPVETVEIEN